MKKLIKIIAVAGVGVASLTLGPVAHAHGTAPTALECAVNGSVATDWTSYHFIQSQLSCAGTYEGVAGTGVYNVAADGTTQGIVGGAEDCNAGKDAGDGTLSATKVSGSGPSSLDGNVTFTRAGSTVVAQGDLTDENGHKVHFDSVMQFIPNPPQQLAGCTSTPPPPMTASLVGEATVTDK